ncbi:MAG TPA: dehydrogenase E1 component subunit alpha/beta [Ilumatobacter sp.]|nr:dehydrogenase E1 component subunit alpha/beta [Ilumatobacter sp.]
MFDDTTSHGAPQGIAHEMFTDGELLEMFDLLAVPRTIEQKMLNMLRQGRLSKWFSGIGQEAIAVGVTYALDSGDWVLPMHRNLGVWTTRGVDLDRLFRQVLGRADGFTAGRDRTFHFGTLEHHLVGMISHLGATMPVADGLALAGRLNGTNQVAASFTGEGATSEGDVHEAMNLAAVWKLPVIFVVENNGYGLSTPSADQFACAQVADRAVGYGMVGEVVDGNDVCAVVTATRRAAERARSGEGPTLLEFMTFRMRGHEETSGTDYVPRELFEQWSRLDPLDRLFAALEQRGALDTAGRDERLAVLKADLEGRINAAAVHPVPSSTPERELGDVYAPRSRPVRQLVGESQTDTRYLDAITDAMRTAMRDDPSVVLLGQDIAEYGGAFKATVGFVEEFGRERVRNTPIIESGAIGAAIGLALDGFRPIVELQFGDFISCGFNQIVNQLATTHYRWGAALPVVIRAPIGGGTGAGPFHSQNIEGWFGNVAGLKVVAPSTAADARGLLLEAIDDDAPVLYLEHKRLYRTVSDPVPSGWVTVPIGSARIVRPGRHATVVTYGGTVQVAVDTADQLARDGVDVEVIDLRSLVPWDVDTVVDSVTRTSRCLVLHEAPVTGGFGGEIAATVSERAFYALDAPVRRLGALDTPIPFAKQLEELHLPNARLEAALRDLCDA